MTTTLTKCLSNFAEETNIFPKWQFGFRKGRSTVTAATILYEAAAERINAKPKSKPTFVAFIDFSKCFDTVRRDYLYIKLQRAGIPFDFCNLLNFIYGHTRSFIMSGIHLVNYFESTIGLPQGCGLSPILFFIFVHYIPDFLSHEGITLHNSRIKFLQFADDLALLATTAKELQIALNDLANYCTINGLNINVDKTKVLIFHKGRTSKFTFTIAGREVQIVNSFTYLGFTFTTQLKFTDHLQKITTKAASKCGILFSKIKTRDVPLSVMLDLFTCYVLPVYQYGLALHIGKYSENAMNAANAVFSKFLKRYLGIPYWSNNSITYFITGTQPLMTTLQQLGQKSINALKFPHVLHGHKLSLVRNINTSVRYDPIQFIPNTF